MSQGRAPDVTIDSRVPMTTGLPRSEAIPEIFHFPYLVTVSLQYGCEDANHLVVAL